MSGLRVGVRGEQLAMLPGQIGDLLPDDHPVWGFLELADELDLSAFEAAYRRDRRGRPPYEPKMMLTLILYCRSKKLASGREIAAACYDDLGARMITQNRYPTRTVIDRFLRTQAGPVRALLAQTLRLGAGEDLVDVAVVAGDGTKILASAAMDATLSEEHLCAQIGDLHTQIAATQARWTHQVTREEGTDTTVNHHGDYLFQEEAVLAAASAPTPSSQAPHREPPTDEPPASAQTLWRTLTTLQTTLHARQAALAYLRTHPSTARTDLSQRRRRAEAEITRLHERMTQTRTELQDITTRRQAAIAAGAKIPGTRPVPVEEHFRMRRHQDAIDRAESRLRALATEPAPTTRINTTDPTSAIMPGKHDGFAQRHNVQALACRNQFIIAIGTHPSSNDKQALTTLLHTARANLDAAGITDPLQVALFDNGYASDANFTADLPVDTLLIAVLKEHKQTSTSPTTPMLSQAPSWQIMADRLTTPENRALYKRRSSIIEPLFAQLFARFGRTLHHRGAHVDTELHLWAVTHNLLKISRHRHKTRTT